MKVPWLETPYCRSTWRKKISSLVFIPTTVLSQLWTLWHNAFFFFNTMHPHLGQTRVKSSDLCASLGRFHLLSLSGLDSISLRQSRPMTFYFSGFPWSPEPLSCSDDETFSTHFLWYPLLASCCNFCHYLLQFKAFPKTSSVNSQHIRPLPWQDFSQKNRSGQNGRSDIGGNNDRSQRTVSTFSSTWTNGATLWTLSWIWTRGCWWSCYYASKWSWALATRPRRFLFLDEFLVPMTWKLGVWGSKPTQVPCALPPMLRHSFHGDSSQELSQALLCCQVFVPCHAGLHPTKKRVQRKGSDWDGFNHMILFFSN